MTENLTFKKEKAYAKTPTVYQMEATECGAASLAMIFAYFGKEIPLERMRVETGVSRDGSKAGNLVLAARRLGLSAKGYRYSLKKLTEETSVPCIIHWNFNHFVVYEGKKGNRHYLNDPAEGRRRLTKEELDDGYTGIAIQFQKKEGFQKRREKGTLAHFVRARLKGQSGEIASLLLTGLFLVFPGLMMPVFSSVFIDDVLIGGTTAWFMKFLILMCVTIAFQMFFTYLKSALLLKLQNKLSLVSAYGFISHMFRLPMNFFDQRNAGDLSGRVENNDNVSVFLAGELGETVLNIFISAFYLFLLLMYSPLLTLREIHIGHLSGVIIHADVYTRFLKETGRKAYLISGTDGYGVAVYQHARQKLGRKPKEEELRRYVEGFHERQKETLGAYAVRPDYYGNDTEKGTSKELRELCDGVFRKLCSEGGCAREIRVLPRARIGWNNFRPKRCVPVLPPEAAGEPPYA